MLYGYEKFVIAWFTLARHTKVPFCCVHVFGSANISLLLALSFVYDKSSTKTKPPWNEWNRAINSSFVLPFLSRLMLNTRVSSSKHAEVHICANMTFIPIHTRHGRKERAENNKKEQYMKNWQTFFHLNRHSTHLQCCCLFPLFTMMA